MLPVVDQALRVQGIIPTAERSSLALLAHTTAPLGFEDRHKASCIKMKGNIAPGQWAER